MKGSVIIQMEASGGPYTACNHKLISTGSQVSTEMNPHYWDKWPSDNTLCVPPLRDRPCMDFHLGIEPADRNWRRGVLRSGNSQDRTALDETILRLYHLTAILQTYFSNPNHGNFIDPYLETLLIILSRRTRIAKAHEAVAMLMEMFPGPSALVMEANRSGVTNIVSRCGIGKGRPETIIRTTRMFMEMFPDGNYSDLFKGSDANALHDLSAIEGIGPKTVDCVRMYSLGIPVFAVDANISRIIERSGMLDGIIALDEGIGQKRTHEAVRGLIPPSIIVPLHAGLVSLGNSHCKPRVMNCDGCPIKLMCRHYRMNVVLPRKTESPTHIDLFCGAGGFGTGFSAAGFRTVLAADLSRDACNTMRMNHPDIPNGNVMCMDLSAETATDVLKRASSIPTGRDGYDIDVITAGIPCQGFSKAGYRSRPGAGYDPLDDPRNHLYRVVLDWVDTVRPRYVVIENVPDLRSAGSDSSNIFRSILEGFGALGYLCDYEVVNAADLGIAQDRRRLIIIASRENVPKVYVKEIIPSDVKHRGVWDAIFGLPEVTAASGKWYTPLNKGVVTGHVSRFNNDEDLEIFGEIKPGERYVDFIKRRRDIIDRRRARGKRVVYETESFSDKYHRLDPNEPSRTIVAHLNKDGNGYIHPYQVRSITPREAMRIQGFDDDYCFCGSMGSQFVQTGNAVPPILALMIARELLRHITNFVSD